MSTPKRTLVVLTANLDDGPRVLVKEVADSPEEARTRGLALLRAAGEHHAPSRLLLGMREAPPVLLPEVRSPYLIDILSPEPDGRAALLTLTEGTPYKVRRPALPFDPALLPGSRRRVSGRKPGPKGR